MDDLSFQLAIALQLEDIEGVISSRKGKGKAGDVATSNEVAFSDYREHLQKTAQILRDECLAQSLARAVIDDAEILLELTNAEKKDESDRELAFRLSGNPSTTVVNKDRRWRDLAVGSGIEVTDDFLEQLKQKSLEWDIIESQVLSFISLNSSES